MSQGNPPPSFEYFNAPLNPQSSFDIPSEQHPDLSNTRRTSDAAQDNDATARSKRTACTLCRKRKLRCDGTKPSCATCARLKHDCCYDEVRKKSGPKRGYVKVLEARLAQVESMLKTQDSTDGNEMDTSEPLETADTRGFADMARGEDIPDETRENAVVRFPMMSSAKTKAVRRGEPGRASPVPQPTMYYANMNSSQLGSFMDPDPVERTAARPAAAEAITTDPAASDPFMADFSWDLIALGLEEPLPAPEIIDDLYSIFFSSCHPTMPFIHQGRFFAAMNLAPHSRPPVSLRYGMWACAAATSDKYESLKEPFYRRARKYLEIDEMRGQGESMLTVAHCQAWVLCSIYEFQNMHFPRAWLSTGCAIRLGQMIGIDRIDGGGLDVKEALQPSKDWTEMEERRRTFWATYWCDRCASIGTGWPMTIDERDIRTNLPASEEAYQRSQSEATPSLAEALEGRNLNLSAYSMSLIMGCMFGRNLTHLHRPTPVDRPSDLNGQFWMRHRKIDSILTNIALNLPDRLRLGGANPESIVIFLNMSIHTSTICLHQAAITMADKHAMQPGIAAESKLRCITAAGQIATIMKTVCHMDLSTMNPFMAFCLYVAGRVFVQYLRARPNDQQSASSFHFLLSAMHALKKRNPLNESFLAQLELDMEGAGLGNPYNDDSPQAQFRREQYLNASRPKHPSGCISIFNELDGAGGLSNSTMRAHVEAVNKNTFLGGRAPDFGGPEQVTQPQPTPAAGSQSGNFTRSADAFEDQYIFPGQYESVPFYPHQGPRQTGVVTELSPGGANDNPEPSTRDSSRASFSTPHANSSTAPTPGQDPLLFTPATMEMPLHGAGTTNTFTGDFGGFSNAVFGGGSKEGNVETPFGYEMWEGEVGMGGGTGMTPASGEQWAQMLDSISGWDGDGGEGRS